MRQFTFVSWRNEREKWGARTAVEPVLMWKGVEVIMKPGGGVGRVEWRVKDMGEERKNRRGVREW